MFPPWQQITPESRPVRVTICAEIRYEQFFKLTTTVSGMRT
jgi:hypothetical protein